MSILIDEMIEGEMNGAQTQHIDGRWYVSKGLRLFTYKTIFRRIKDAYRVLVGKSIAVHYKEDE